MASFAREHLAGSRVRSHRARVYGCDFIDGPARQQPVVQGLVAVDAGSVGEKLVHTLARACAQCRGPEQKSSARRTIASASVAGQAGRTTNPLRPSTMASALPPTFVTTIGNPAAINSRIAFENPSSWLARMPMSDARAERT